MDMPIYTNAGTADDETKNPVWFGMSARYGIVWLAGLFHLTAGLFVLCTNRTFNRLLYLSVSLATCNKSTDSFTILLLLLLEQVVSGCIVFMFSIVIILFSNDSYFKSYRWEIFLIYSILLNPSSRRFK